MADLDTSSSGHKGDKKVRSKKMSTKIDMTPMVDLAFLLVTFFILTISFAKAKTMQLMIPDRKDTSKPPPVKQSEALTLILGEDNLIFYYFGFGDNSKVLVSNFSEKGIRKVVTDFNQKIKAIQQASGNKVVGPVIMIKPLDKSKYDNLVAILDEMKIAGIERYALVDVTKDEESMIQQAVNNSRNNNNK